MYNSLNLTRTLWLSLNECTRTGPKFTSSGWFINDQVLGSGRVPFSGHVVVSGILNFPNRKGFLRSSDTISSCVDVLKPKEHHLYNFAALACLPKRLNCTNLGLDSSNV